MIDTLTVAGLHLLYWLGHIVVGVVVLGGGFAIIASLVDGIASLLGSSR